MDAKICKNCHFAIKTKNKLRCTNPLNTNGVNMNMRSNRACNQDWHLTPVYVSFEVDKDDFCKGFKWKNTVQNVNKQNH